MTAHDSKSLIVIGGGAAGFFCAVNAARMGARVTLLEKTGKLLSKVRVSGGGRCNVTHQLFEVSEFSRRYPRGQNFLKKTLHHFDAAATIRWFEERGVDLKAEADGRMFPVTDSSETVIACLLREAARYGVEIRMNAEVKSLLHVESGFRLELADGRPLEADAVCVAAGGYPKAAQFAWLQALGHSIAEPLPSLFTFNLPKHPITELMGVSTTARVKIEGSKLSEEGPVLITHWGLSGPAVLRLSAWGARELAQGQYNFRVHVHWAPQHTEADLKAAITDARRQHPQKKVHNQNLAELPARLWQFLLRQSGIGEEQRFADLPAKAENALIRHISDSVFEVKGKTTFKEEFVTAGGIQLSEIDANTMMSRKVPGLYFAGEVMDVDGITGGFNFQHAWTSGWIAAKAIAGT
ncbi:NAD(P)/FAD-dependent oxidoreductase [Flaviaesturariibacter flavus]|uniref:NAD(P)/FAD-dependent oxidoreductase n=1 Tax=Flaviaesturariibacter flavus TaxID=2502780 RepID=A0A4R1BJR4_9BACT|nr:NAD(P)/FAD-dependent oxidoreductase [Flaviaesturariibacter flavus]TCJ17529.1 NAD(P)/FAD-dependent oxidoreductase [Flaviaesturariibacter flavus]